MRVIGITGGVGSGKTAVLSYIGNKYNCEVIFADEVAHKVKEPGQICYQELISLLGADILGDNQEIDRGKMAEKIFSDELILQRVNELIHPAVKQYIQDEIERVEYKKKLDFLFIEAALLIEDGYENIADELWYIYAEEEVRRKRLSTLRSYNDEKITSILQKQLSEEMYKKHCRVLINNNGSLQDTYRQIDDKLEGYLWQR